MSETAERDAEVGALTGEVSLSTEPSAAEQSDEGLDLRRRFIEDAWPEGRSL
jgi:hypothetical protein